MMGVMDVSLTRFSPDGSVRKATTTDKIGEDLEFVLSDETVDRLDDVIALDGWDLSSFKSNPVALFGHRNDFVIGRWHNVRVEKGGLRGKLVLAEQDTSERVNEVRSLVRQGFLRAVSVGFQPVEMKAREGSKRGGVVFTKSALLEVSLVSVPANPNALQVAKSLNVSRDTIELVFGKSAVEHARDDRGSSGKSAEIPPVRRAGIMSTNAERIEAAQNAYLAAKSDLEMHLAGLDDNNVSDAQMQRTQELNNNVKGRSNVLAALKESEILLGSTSVPATVSPATRVPAPNARVWATPTKKIEPRDYVFRTHAIMLKHHARMKAGAPMSIYDTMREGYGDDINTRAFFDVVTRTASFPASTTDSDWALPLVQTSISDFIDSLMPNSVYPGLSARGGRFTFGRNGKISLPSRSATPTIGGAFVLEGDPIPVKEAAFVSITLVPKKMGVITTMTRELTEHSVPSIEAILRSSIQEDTAVAIDSVLLDAGAATATRPAGILNGATTAAGTAGGGLTAIVTDVKGMVGSLITSTLGNIRAPTWIMNPVQALALGMQVDGSGNFLFEDEVQAGRFRGFPLLTSTSVTAGTVILVDAADFFSATGDTPRFDVSDQAVLHMETSPLPIATGVQGSGVLATPTRSLWQTDSIGLRMVMDINWSFRRTGSVVARTAVTW